MKSYVQSYSGFTSREELGLSVSVVVVAWFSTSAGFGDIVHAHLLQDEPSNSPTRP